jgi:hypothetical protein
MGVDKSYDIQIPKFKDDLNFGLAGEEVIKQFLKDVSGGKIEVKTDRYRNGRMVVETQQKPVGREDWVDSGINVTQAEWWVYQYGLDGAFHVISVPRLKRYLRAQKSRFNDKSKISLGYMGDNPARGYLLYPNDVTDMLTNPKYDAV